ncbi:HTH-type transcriptional regulator EutR [Pseudomonas nicosulfuronedens]|uniref:HTH-type transcriptional regulator EutR n=1 Tax=Pseudomonas nicosulfuronedens TaxID=2571105 RepID=A0A5R9RBJ8_9PSED|nr:HTH-type transcriptional regulator EutR [Pseudomonas nicosulfuronedens]MDH1008010.1 HTH-type transcriptional regulator EutR [Pseudomonas nicosulfuronedens]MDH1978288.1 HTH-type transcriptional regulator EutR [Pseudomonas nicosulfuronedens]MDH2025121.1 HTH-type transcriptional regulator EutR [Pseudomonas nicosulfuronedens]TLX80643.1 HTH-type transcriptional regulator EutR [Pseudomonas nicosulfuronedens]
MSSKKREIDLHHLWQEQGTGGPAQEPLGRSECVRLRRTEDVYAHACHITAWQQLYDQLRPGAFQGELDEVWLKGLQFFRERTSHALHQSCMVWPGAFWFGIPFATQAQGYIGRRQIDTESIAVRPGGREFELSTPDDYGILGLVVDRGLLQEQLEFQGQAQTLCLLEEHTVLHLDAAHKQRLCMYIDEALEVAAKAPASMGTPAVGKQLSHELLLVLLAALQGAQTVDLDCSVTSLRKRQIVSRAREYVLDNPSDHVTVLDLCQRLHVSQRTLQNCFLEVIGRSPMNYLKAVRLNAVHRELGSPYSTFNTVQDAAMAWGFWHMGQFSRDYLTHFGARPSHTLAERARLSTAW